MKAKAEYIEATTQALEDSQKKDLKNFKILPDSDELSLLFDNLNKILVGLEKIPANDLAFLKLNNSLELQRTQQEIPSSLIKLMEMATTKLNNEFLSNNANKNKIKIVSYDERLELYSCVLTKLPVNQAQYQIIDFILTNYLNKVERTNLNTSFSLFCGMVIEYNQVKGSTQPKSEKIVDTDKIIDLIDEANRNLDQYQKELEEKINKDISKNQKSYLDILNLEKNEGFRDPGAYSKNKAAQTKGIIKSLSHKTIRDQLIAQEESILLPRKAGEFSSEVIDDLMRYEVIQEARKKLNDPKTMQPTKRFQNAGEYLERNEAIITRSRDSFYRTLGKGLLAFFTMGIALFAYLLAENKDTKLTKQFDYRNSFFYNETETSEEKPAIDDEKSSPNQSGQSEQNPR